MTFEQFAAERYSAKPYDFYFNPQGFPSYQDGSSDVSAHLPILQLFASYCKTACEFGVRNNFSSVALLRGLSKNNGTLHSYDIIETQSNRDLMRMKLPAQWFFHIQNTVEEGFKIDRTDLIFIDSLHTAHQIKQELAIHADQVNKYIIFHDVFSQGNISLDVPGEEGILLSIEEFLANNSQWKVVYNVKFNHGLMVIENTENIK